MISQTAEYALRAMLHLAGNPGISQTTRQVGAVTRVPVAYLSKVMQSLAHAGLVQPQRGLHGGFTLKRVPTEISVYEVIMAVDPIKRIEGCPLGLLSHGANLCPLHRRLDDVIALVERAFQESTLADLLAQPTASKPLCPFPISIGAEPTSASSG